ncbi:hypothetical protein PINS_up005485 [Pythium insidiosum]|nr:hypothetical protein PINS_up005485 [Pythium insidiosum]
MAPPQWTALPLVNCDGPSPSSDAAASADGLRLQLGDDALAFLTSLPSPTLHVVGFTGPRHTGKRLLLRTMFHAPPLEHESSERRVLIWLWRPTAADTSVVVLTADAGDDDDERLHRASHVLLMLLSSVLLYNDDGEINAAALERLAWLEKLSAWLRIKPNQDDEVVARDFHQHAPKLVWLVRNSKIKWLTDSATGEKISATQYLEQALADESGFSDAVATRNAQRMYINSYFRQREAVALSRAVEANATESAETPRDALRAQFVESVDKLFDKYIRSARQVPSKTLLGRELAAADITVVLETYVDALNRGALPVIQAATNAVLQRTLTTAVDGARKTYEESMNGIIEAIESPVSDADAAATRTGVTERVLLMAHRRGLQAAMIRLEHVAFSLPESMRRSVYHDAVEAFKQDLLSRFDSLQANNQIHWTAHCDAVLGRVLPDTLDKMAAELETRSRDSFSDGLVSLLTQYKSDLRAAIESFKSQCRPVIVASKDDPIGDGKAAENHDGGLPSIVFESFERALLAAVVGSVKAWGASVLRQYQAHTRALHDQRSEVEQELEVVRAQDTQASFSTDDHKRLYEEQIEQSTQQLSELRSVLQSELNSKKDELERLLSDMSTMDLKHDARVKNMENDITWERNRAAELERAAIAERERLEQDVSGATSEMLEKQRGFHEEERTLLTQQKELLARIVELERELVQKKTRHVQQVFTVETELSRQTDALKQEQAEFARQLKAQAKTDTGVLKLAYQKKKAVVQAELDRVSREVQEYETRLAALEAAAAPSSRRTASVPTATTQTAATAAPVTSTATPSTNGAASTTAQATRPTASRSDTDMCKAQ